MERFCKRGDVIKSSLLANMADFVEVKDSNGCVLTGCRREQCPIKENYKTCSFVVLESELLQAKDGVRVIAQKIDKNNKLEPEKVKFFQYNNDGRLLNINPDEVELIRSEI